MKRRNFITAIAAFVGKPLQTPAPRKLNLRALIDALPPEGGVIDIPAGMWVIYSHLTPQG